MSHLALQHVSLEACPVLFRAVAASYGQAMGLALLLGVAGGGRTASAFPRHPSSGLVPCLP